MIIGECANRINVEFKLLLMQDSPTVFIDKFFAFAYIFICKLNKTLGFAKTCFQVSVSRIT